MIRRSGRARATCTQDAEAGCTTLDAVALPIVALNQCQPRPPPGKAPAAIGSLLVPGLAGVAGGPGLVVAGGEDDLCRAADLDGDDVRAKRFGFRRRLDHSPC